MCTPNASIDNGGAVTSDGTLLAVAHGTDATVRTYTLDAAGVPTATGWLFDVGIQGDLGTVAFLDLPTRRVLLATAKFNSGNGTGLLSFTVNPDGSGTLNGTVVSTQGPTPEFMAVWQPTTQPCYANCDASTGTPALTPADFVCFLNKFRAGDPYANCDASTGTPALTPADFVCFLNKFRAGC
ncbi:hypothetical protein J4558_23920 [Leptolyngbya sp. 15MV]|nr:hypothetical protein J4558_23920 [Leptolyngbya sp. 15MV]